MVEANGRLKALNVVTLLAFFSKLPTVVILVTGQAAVVNGYKSYCFSCSTRKLALFFGLVAFPTGGQSMFPQQWIA